MCPVPGLSGTRALDGALGWPASNRFGVIGPGEIHMKLNLANDSALSIKSPSHSTNFPPSSHASHRQLCTKIFPLSLQSLHKLSTEPWVVVGSGLPTRNASVRHVFVLLPTTTWLPSCALNRGLAIASLIVRRFGARNRVRTPGHVAIKRFTTR